MVSCEARKERLARGEKEQRRGNTTPYMFSWLGWNDGVIRNYMGQG
jgi:hypothetical protein